MKKLLASLLMLCLLLSAVILVSCTPSEGRDADDNTPSAPEETPSAPIETPTTPTMEPEIDYDDNYYLISGFDIRTIGDYPVIEKALQQSLAISRELTREDFLNVTELSIRYSDVQDIAPLAAMQNLTFLDLAGNDISDILPLTGMSKLTDAILSDNNISDISPLVGWICIERLRLSSNPISDITVLGQLENLKQVFLVNCPIQDYSPVEHVVFVEPYERLPTSFPDHE